MTIQDIITNGNIVLRYFDNIGRYTRIVELGSSNFVIKLELLEGYSVVKDGGEVRYAKIGEPLF